LKAGQFAHRFLPWQFLSRARVEHVIIDRLDTDDGGNTEDIMSIGAARNICGWAVQAE
jgi:hypothetical protein